MSATRNPYYQLPGGADLPGDVRVSDTADSTKTAADGWAASPAAVAAATKVETGTIDGVSNVHWTRYGRLVLIECSSSEAFVATIPEWGNVSIGKLPFEAVDDNACVSTVIARTGIGKTLFNGVLVRIHNGNLIISNWGDGNLTNANIVFSLSYICK